VRGDVEIGLILVVYPSLPCIASLTLA